jgi:hypothetical protein
VLFERRGWGEEVGKEEEEEEKEDFGCRWSRRWIYSVMCRYIFFVS